MESLNIILGVLASLFAGLNIVQLIFLRQTKKKYMAEVEKAAIETADTKHDYMEKRIESLEKLYHQQGLLLDKFRQRQLELESELQEKNTRIVKLEGENKLLLEKVNALDEEVKAYKTITRKP